MLKAEGLSVGKLQGKMSGKKQDAELDSVRQRTVAGLVCNYRIVSEGLDLPQLVHIIKLDGIYEEQVLEQQKGRVERICDNKDFGLIHIPQDTHHKALRRNAKRMLNYYKKAGLETQVL